MEFRIARESDRKKTLSLQPVRMIVRTLQTGDIPRCGWNDCVPKSPCWFWKRLKGVTITSVPFQLARPHLQPCSRKQYCTACCLGVVVLCTWMGTFPQRWPSVSYQLLPSWTAQKGLTHKEWVYLLKWSERFLLEFGLRGQFRSKRTRRSYCEKARKALPKWYSNSSS